MRTITRPPRRTHNIIGNIICALVCFALGGFTSVGILLAMAGAVP